MDFCRKIGRFDLVLELIKNRLEDNILDLDALCSLASVYYLMGDKEVALEVLKSDDVINFDSYSHLMESSKIFYYLEAK